MKIRRVLIIVIPILFIFSLVFFSIMPKILQKEEQAFQAARQQGWTTYFQEEEDLSKGSFGGEGNKIITDTTGKIWVAGEPRLGGLSFFDGTTWILRHTGSYSDLALGPQGQMLAVHESGDSVDGVEIYDGQDWKIYDGPRSKEAKYNTNQEIIQVEVDGNGRIWVVMNDFGTQTISEMSIDQDKAVATFSQPEITIKKGQIKSLEADSQGNLWASIWHFDDAESSDEWPSGLYVFNGEKWKQISGQGVDLRRVVATAFDKQGTAWIATECGGVMTYDGKNWDTILAENTVSKCKESSLRLLKGIAIDNQDRVWVWSEQSVKFLNGKDWVTFTPENSGFAEVTPYGPFISDVMVDDLDQVWIAYSGGVSMSAIEDIQPLAKEVTIQHARSVALTTRLQGKIWLVSSLLALLWLALYFNMPRSIILALIISLIVSILMGPPMVQPFYDYEYSYPNPLLIAIIFGILGGLVGGLIYKTTQFQNKTKPPWDIMVMIFGFVVPFCLCSSFIFFAGHP